MGRTWVAETPGEQSATQVGDEHDPVGEGRVEVEKCGAKNDDGDAVGHQVFPTAMQERQRQDAEKTFRRMWNEPISAQVDAQ